jgi:WD40 repeat protein
MRRLQGHEGTVRSLAYSPDGRHLASAGEDGQIHVWSLATGEVVKTIACSPAGVEVIVFLPDGKGLLAGSADGHLTVLDWTANTCTFSRKAHERGVRCLALAPELLVAVTSGWDNSVYRWDLSRDARLSEPRELSGAIDHEVSALTFLPGGDHLISGSWWDGLIYLLDRDTGKMLDTLGEEMPVHTIACSPCDGLIAWGHSRTSIHLIRARYARLGPYKPDLTDHGVTAPVHTYPKAPICALAFAPDGRRLLSASEDGTIHIALVESGQLLQAFNWHLDTAFSLAVSPDGMTAAAGGVDGTIAVWDLDDL